MLYTDTKVYDYLSKDFGTFLKFWDLSFYAVGLCKKSATNFCSMKPKKEVETYYVLCICALFIKYIIYQNKLYYYRDMTFG